MMCSDLVPLYMFSLPMSNFVFVSALHVLTLHVYIYTCVCVCFVCVTCLESVTMFCFCALLYVLVGESFLSL